MAINNIARPGQDEYAPHYGTYISKVKSDDLIAELDSSMKDFINFMRTVPEAKLDYRYQDGKWTIREIIIHLMDAERIFTYRALRFSRNDQTPLSGFDENEYVPESNAATRSLDSLIEEYSALRNSTIALYKNFTPQMTMRTGIANGKEISVRALGYVIPGHEIHHMGVIKERYL